MSESMLERVAMAIYHGQPRNRPWDKVPTDLRRQYDEKARAAIEAMRDPTPKMLKAACASMSPDKRPTPDRVSVKAKHGIRYRAMIDAALSETRKP